MRVKILDNELIQFENCVAVIYDRFELEDFLDDNYDSLNMIEVSITNEFGGISLVFVDKRYLVPYYKNLEEYIKSI